MRKFKYLISVLIYGLLFISLNNYGQKRKAYGAEFKIVTGSILTGPEMDSHNTFDEPENIKPSDFKNLKINGNTITVEMPSKSVVVLELK